MFYYSSSVTRDITPNKQWGKKKNTVHSQNSPRNYF